MTPARNAAQDQMLRKIGWRILPFLLVLYVMSYLDRTNVAFARAPMSEELGFSERVYGVGTGLFFIGYFLLGLPGALIVQKWGARRLVGCTAVAWGLVTVAFTFLKTPGGFFALRLLLGLCAAPFFPGVIVHITRWFPLSDRSRALAGFMIAAPISLTIAGPLSGLMLRIHEFGFRSWQWIFIIEGLVTICLGLIVFPLMDDSPKDASWLKEPEREALLGKLEEESKVAGPTKAAKWWTALGDRNVLLLCLAHAFVNIAGYGFIFWLPSAVKTALGSSTPAANAISAIPFGLSAVVMWLMARSSDRTGERKRHACFPMLGAASFFLLTLIPGLPPALTIVWISLAGACIFGWIPGFWALPTAIATGSARAGAIGLVNSIGNLGGFLGPAIIGELLTRTHSGKALVLLVASSYCAAALSTSLVRVKQPA
jgi:sugar phosphate permease